MGTEDLTTIIKQSQEKRVRFEEPHATKAGGKRSKPCVKGRRSGRASEPKDQEHDQFADQVPETMPVEYELQAYPPGIAVSATFKKNSRLPSALRDSSMQERSSWLVALLFLLL